ncbi:MAG: tetratricopeptide repeat protein [bacterium]|nr:tetratricopeptide repeat protein [bacterium]
MRLVFSTVTIFLLLFTALLFAQENQENKKKKAPPKQLNLEKAADDMKFRNGIQFIKLNRDDKAIEALNEYLEIYYNGIHRHEAYKRLAEIAINKFDYQEAIKIYRSLFEEFSNSTEGVEAYYRIGLCYKKMGYDKKALRVFKEILSNFSDSDYAEQARIQVDMLKILNEN